MQKYLPTISSHPLFAGINLDDVETLLGCLGARVDTYQSQQVVLSLGSQVRSIGIVVSGCVEIEQFGLDGSRHVLSEVCAPGSFGEAFVCAHTTHSPVRVIATQDSRVMWLAYSRLVKTCSSACGFHNALIMNLLAVLARRNIEQTSKLELLAARSIRGRLMTYLESQALRDRTTTVTIPFRRDELADYLCVDRSALSREIGNMVRDGICSCPDKHTFIINSK